MGEDTFRDLLNSWIGPARLGTPAIVVPDGQKADIIHSVAPRLNSMGMLPFRYQIKATGSPTYVSSPIVGCQSIRFKFHSDREARDLQSFAIDSRDFYLVIGVADTADIGSLYERALSRRFDFYGIDLHQYFRRINGPLPTFVDIPVRNRLTLGLFALLVSAKWVEQFTGDFSSQLLSDDANLQYLIQAMTMPLDGFSRDDGFEAQAQKFSDLSGGDASRRRAYARAAQLASIRSISARLIAGSGGEEIDTYSPEALSGMVNLWLFNKQYHEFMRASIRKSGRSERLLPVDTDSLHQLSRLEQATLYLVRHYYQLLGAEARLVRRLRDRGGEDYSTWDGALPEFSWIKFNEEGSYDFNLTKMSASAVDVDAIDVARRGVLNAGGFDLFARGEFGTLNPWEVDLASEPPIMLFPAEGDYVEYPVQLWTRTPWARVVGR